MASSCSQPVKDVIIDNPTEEEIKIQLDGSDEITIPAGEKVIVPVKFGKQNLVINGSEAVEINLDKKLDYVMNPTQSQYYIENMVYTTSNRGRKQYFEDYGRMTSKVGAWEIEGDYEKIKPDYLIQKSWVFGLDEGATNQVQISINPTKGYKTVRRLVREKDILAQVRTQLLDEFTKAIETEE